VNGKVVDLQHLVQTMRAGSSVASSTGRKAAERADEGGTRVEVWERGKKEEGGARDTFSGAVRQQGLQQNRINLKARENLITIHGDKHA
jgi:hypothetical protein